ncbi:membrane protein [Altererythrobacter sp. B11]|uniref:MAPEG family protein n=1 Tax=Altererythrobacter sp. B11 TaxID=2060312 RepID=UPI000DC70801|nr:MAPEG family protein [Altererythrobacter sp. B11]BBC71879.1 membrane protein [Altererythrobacter sp. B11]
MPAELLVLALACLLLLAHVLLAGYYKTQQYGREWNMGARDEDLPPLNHVAGRLDRARGNFLETFPIAVAALLGVVLAGKAGPVSAAAAWVWLAARVIYLPLYWTGVPKVRTLVWGVGLLALLVVLGVLLLG